MGSRYRVRTPQEGVNFRGCPNLSSPMKSIGSPYCGVHSKRYHPIRTITACNRTDYSISITARHDFVMWSFVKILWPLLKLSVFKSVLLDHLSLLQPACETDELDGRSLAMPSTNSTAYETLLRRPIRGGRYPANCKSELCFYVIVSYWIKRAASFASDFSIESDRM